MRALGFVFLILSALVICTIQSRAQEKPDRQEQPEFRVAVRLVEVTLRVKSADGRHVTDITPDELTVLVNGVERDISLFEPVVTGLERFSTGEETSLAPGIDIPAAREYPPRYFMIMLHQIQFRFGTFQKTKAALIEFIDQSMLPNDYVSVVGFDKRIDFALDFTNDKEKVLEALENMHLKFRNISMTDDFFKHLGGVAARAAKMPHKVNIILVAEGMLGIGGPGGFMVYDQAIQHLQAADVRVFGVDAGGLNFRDPGARVARMGFKLGALIKQSFNLGLYSEPTGGNYYRYNNNIAGLLRKVDYEMSAYYIVGFNLAQNEGVGDGDKAFAIKIKSSRPGVRLYYKKRFAPIFRDQEKSRKQTVH